MISQQHVGQKVFVACSYSVSEVTLVKLGDGDWANFATVERPAVRGTLLRAETNVELIDVLFPTSDEAYAAVDAKLAAYKAKGGR